jgi:hypothetical protein
MNVSFGTFKPKLLVRVMSFLYSNQHRINSLIDISCCSALQERMQVIQDHGTSGGERADAIDHCLAGISKLSNDVKDISGSLPAHDQRTYSEVSH